MATDARQLSRAGAGESCELDCVNVSLIVAMSENRVIGVDNRLPWRLPADLQRFKRLTMGHHIVMGRHTWDSIGRALPGRTSVVVTRQRDFRAPDGVLVTHSPADALAACADDDEPFVIGGAELYRHALPLARRVHLTVIERHFDGDTYFPALDDSWTLAETEPHRDDDLPHRFELWQRAPVV
jgi:dihydrofolate reductase